MPTAKEVEIALIKWKIGAGPKKWALSLF